MPSDYERAAGQNARVLAIETELKSRGVEVAKTSSAGRDLRSIGRDIVPTDQMNAEPNAGIIDSLPDVLIISRSTISHEQRFTNWEAIFTIYNSEDNRNKKLVLDVEREVLDSLLSEMGVTNPKNIYCLKDVGGLGSEYDQAGDVKRLNMLVRQVETTFSIGARGKLGYDKRSIGVITEQPTADMTEDELKSAYSDAGNNGALIAFISPSNEGIVSVSRVLKKLCADMLKVNSNASMINDWVYIIENLPGVTVAINETLLREYRKAMELVLQAA